MESTGNISKHLCLVFLLVIGFGDLAFAQQNSDRAITINMSASETLPADLIIFQININAEAENPVEAFETHKKRESLLADLLQEFDIEEENIDYDPISIRRQYRNNNKPDVSVTSQSVNVTFEDFSIYEKIQITLIENEFDSFNGKFSSSEISEGKEKALIKAIDSAKEKAELIAKTAGVKLGAITHINFSDHEIGYPPMLMEARGYDRSSGSMMDFGQTVSVKANINISFGIE